ncbi:MAG: prephenate dehydrogenase/arogenate dehydrogenase family protein [Acidimicrobiia bacterium]
MRAAVLGTGLIGTSVAIGLRLAGWRVAGWDPDPTALDGAVSLQALDSRTAGPDEAVMGADLVVAAGPAEAVVDLLGGLETDALVTDVAGVKTPVVAAGARLPHFVGGHPMAGRETSGPIGASGSLFRGALWILTVDGAGSGDLERMRGIVTSLGATPVEMTAEEHDATVALISHLPHVVAAALTSRIAGHSGALDLAGGGFRDLTRVALSEPGWWSDVLIGNREAVASALRRLAGDLTGWAERVESADRPAIVGALEESRRVRASMSAPVAAVSVVLEDQPGEIARVGHALSVASVDLRDLQLRHASHGGGGVLTLSVRAGEVTRLREALSGEGFRVLG